MWRAAVPRTLFAPQDSRHRHTQLLEWTASLSGTMLFSPCCRFRQLTQAKEFLLDPYQRRAFNEAHGFLTPTVNVAWWSGPKILTAAPHRHDKLAARLTSLAAATEAQL